MPRATKRLLQELWRSRIVSIAKVVVALLLAHLTARYLSLRMMTWITQAALLVTPMVLVVLYHQEISGALARLGGWLSFGLLSRRPLEKPGEVIDEVVTAVSSMAARRIGGTVAIERKMGLRGEIERGTPLDAVVTYDLILTVFHPQSPLHDGAIVISEHRLAAARVFFPMTSNPLHNRLGSRHQSAIGLTDGNDAIAIVVSEERGTISLALGGTLTVMTPDSLRISLERLLSATAVARQLEARNS